MKFSINQNELQNALSVVQKGVSTKSTLPVLAGIFVSAYGDEVTFQASDLQLSIQYTTSALVEEEGAAVLPGKLVTDIVKNLPDAAVHLKTEELETVITCESSSFSIKGLDPRDFPGFPEVEANESVRIPFEVFSSMARKVSKVTSKDETRAILNGVLVSVEASTLKMVATDSFRLAVAEAHLENAPEEFQVVIAGGFMSDLASLPKTGEDILISAADNQVIVSYHGTVFVNRRIEGNYPNYKQLIPANYETCCIVDKSMFQAAVKRASLLGTSGSQVRFFIDADAQVLQLSSTSQDVGSTQEIVKAQVDGQSIEIGFNSFYVMDGLNAIESDTVRLELQSSMRPGVLKGDEKENYLYLVMPMKL